MIDLAPLAGTHPVPDRFPSPFDRGAVHPLAQQAARALLAHCATAPAAAWRLDAPGGGKMFGVLVVQAADGTLGWLRAFSGMLGGEWVLPGWAPPVFDMAARDAFWVDGEAEMRAIAAEREALAARGDLVAVRALDARRAMRSRDLLPRIQATYTLRNARGETRALSGLFAPRQPPAGAGDCAGPKLLTAAYHTGLRPVAMAELWIGATPAAGDRVHGAFYPACQGKCAPILHFMLEGLPHDPAPQFGGSPFDASEPRTLYEDAHLVIVDKPSGMLSVPGRGARMQDCVSTRLAARYPASTGQLVVHRLDLDTSGLLLAAKDSGTFVALQRLFSQRAIAKRYAAWLDGDVTAESGIVSLPLRTDVDDRPRQVVDPVHGKVAVTEWRVLERRAGRTRVALVPHTGRTHQLRVHAAHPDGLGVPIVGDRLYGREAPQPGARLLLHAESVQFTHPVTGMLVTVESPAPF